MNQAKQFRDLHYNEQPLIIANAWDVGSAKQLQAMGFKAIATSSGALADTQGYNDGEEIPFDLLLQIAGRMKEYLEVPFSVDMERGFGKDVDGILHNIEQLCRIGVAGINIEDSGNTGPNPLRGVSEFKHVITDIKNFLQRKGLDLFINVRTDAYLHKVPDALDETVKRVQAYEDAGADGVFAPFICQEDDIKTVAAACKIPLNVLAMPGLPDFPTLVNLGVRRVSMGSWLYRSLQAELKKKIETIRAEQSSRVLF
jgi:2-methylisocitrate lyase-like PEP mutase family enzyme